MLHFIWGLLALCATIAQANVEKTIFLAGTATVPSVEPGLDDLGLERLSPDRPALRTRLNASFPSNDVPEGSDSWFFLENLIPGQRYEVRVCWLATQPTALTLTTHPLADTVEDASLLSSLSVFSTARLASLDPRLQANTIPGRADKRSKKGVLGQAPKTDSVLFLRVRAAADYFSTNETLMRDVPPVAVDLILDPYIWNVFPRSLIPTAGWIAVVTVVAVVVARWIARELGRVIADARKERDLQEGKKAR
ncbi:hypothetical protein PENDEC_c005G06561 [Penicillium decumbens]|uniref:Uncharacterized protein n=1 Tax=Penicillium decumbens TaxID=69771 RepID=A0A1V6PGU5_PENDC|nr:hypothetical protein PENDEC_c005G06561 [Penicillium decumbens]